MGTATPPCPDHAGSAPNTLTGAEVVLLCRMFLRRRIGSIELTIHASGGRHRGSHRAAVVAHVLLIFGSSKTPVGRTSPYVPRVSECSRKCRFNNIWIREIWIQISWKSMENRHSPGGISEIGHATPVLSCFSLLPPATWTRFCRANYFIGMLGVIYTETKN